jgi:hypothetical protein
MPVRSPSLEQGNQTGFPGTKVKSPAEALIVISLFGLILAWFSLGTLFVSLCPSSTVSLSEKRMLAYFPHLNMSEKSIVEFPRKFESYLNDHLIDRAWLISRFCFLRYSAFATSTSDKALVGKDGWLYLYFNGDKETLEKSPSFSQVELEAFVNVIRQRKEWATKHGIKYLFVMTPSKSTVYPEFIDHTERRRGVTSRREQLFQALQATSGLDAIDLAPVMVAHKRLGQLYLKTDTHWNQQAAFYGYQTIVNAIRKWYPNIRSIPAITRSETIIYCGDLAKYLGLDGLLLEPVPCFSFPRTSIFSKYPAAPNFGDPLQGHHPFATEKPDSKLPRAFCLGDSFTMATQPYLSESFSRAYFSWSQDFSAPKILSEHPDLIIDEITERLLYWPLPSNHLEESIR